MRRLTFREHVAEPANFWIRHSFAAWPPGVADEVWCDLATGGLHLSGSGPETVPIDAAATAELVGTASDVVYVPPLAVEHELLRAGIVEAAAAAGVPLLVQVTGADVLDAVAAGRRPRSKRRRTAAGLPSNAMVVLDVLDSLVRQAATLREVFRENRQPSLPFEPSPLRNATLVWPFIAGWTDQPEVLDPAMSRFAAAGAHRVLPRSLDLDAHDRRLFAERLQSTWPEAFDALFHGGGAAPDTSAFRRSAEAAGLEHRLPRPLPASPLPARLRLARELAAHLIELGDAAATGGDAYYRAARFLDRDEVDIEAAAREGNLGVLPWLEAPAKQAVEQWLAARRED